jgi:hypothetical protein
MASAIVKELRAQTDAAWTNLTRQLQGMEPHMERADAPGEWTTRQVLSHLLFEPGWNAVQVLKKFSAKDFPLVEIIPGQVSVTPERQKMTLRQFQDTLEAQRRSVFGYLEGLLDAELKGRKARIPLFKQFMGTEEIALSVYVRALFDFHWNDHAGQLAKIRKAVGLPEAR